MLNDVLVFSSVYIIYIYFFSNIFDKSSYYVNLDN